MLVPYDFLAGRLVPCSEEDNRFEIDCNGAGVVVVAARTDTKLSELGDLSSPKWRGWWRKGLEGQSPFVYTGYFPFGY